jgi:hypothetical protein
MSPRQPNPSRLVLVLLLACISMLGCDAKPVDTIQVVSPNGNHDDLMALAREDHVALLEMCQQNFLDQNISDYTCVLLRQERLAGLLHQAQEVDVKFREEPFSVAMAWTVNPGDGDRCIYVDGWWLDENGTTQLLVRPTGFLVQLATSGSVFRLPDEDDVMRGTRKPITLFGFKNMFTGLLTGYAQARANGDSDEQVLGWAEITGRQCIVLQRTIQSPWDDSVVPITKIFIDRDTLLPVRVEGYALDDELLFTYEYDQIVMDVGLTDADFTPQANEITPPTTPAVPVDPEDATDD